MKFRVKNRGLVDSRDITITFSFLPTLLPTLTQPVLEAMYLLQAADWIFFWRKLYESCKKT